MDSDTPDLAALQALCREFGATLVVDVAHDLGNLGPTAAGIIGAQGMTRQHRHRHGQLLQDVRVERRLRRRRERSVKEYLRYYSSPSTFSNAMSPAQRGDRQEGLRNRPPRTKASALRSKLMDNINMLRGLLRGCGHETYGDPSAIVCVKMGSEALARLAGRRLPSLGLLANIVEFPAVPKGQARFRLQVMASHSQHDIFEAVHSLSTAAADARANGRRSRTASVVHTPRSRPTARWNLRGGRCIAAHARLIAARANTSAALDAILHQIYRASVSSRKREKVR